jgi:cysteine synthase A
VIVEGTAGNTGIGLALVGRRARLPLGDRDAARPRARRRRTCCGCAAPNCVEVDAVPYSNPNNYVRYSGRLAEELAAKEPNGAIWANQFDNTANRDGHYRTTGPEIWEQTDGKVDGFICAVGSGGTLAGVALALKERNPKIKIGLADPMGAALYELLLHPRRAEGRRHLDHRGHRPGPHHRKPRRASPVDMAYRITDEEALKVLFDLVEHEGLVPGRLGGHQRRRRHAPRQGARPRPHHRDHPVRLRQRYQSKLFNPAFLREKNGVRRTRMSRVVVCGSLNMDVVVAERAAARMPGETLLGAEGVVPAGGQGPESSRRSGKARNAYAAMTGAVGSDAFGEHAARLPGRQRCRQFRRARSEGPGNRPGADPGRRKATMRSPWPRAPTCTSPVRWCATSPRRDEVWVAQFETPLCDHAGPPRSTRVTAGARTVLNLAPFAEPTTSACCNAVDVAVLNEIELAQATGARVRRGE